MNDLFNLLTFNQNTYNIKANYQVLRIITDKCFCCTFYEPLLIPVYGLFREAEIEICTGLYLNDNNYIIFLGYNIYFLLTAPPVTMKYNITFI